jgi:hypothetical protein|mmetsp:Transcript_12379/g.19062  ORF Transcript_12379/g.19062 Transcript_12379/m.19062 type:complete len:96 (+) Transcript_12379:504-791(+)
MCCVQLLALVPQARQVQWPRNGTKSSIIHSGGLAGHEATPTARLLLVNCRQLAHRRENPAPDEVNPAFAQRPKARVGQLMGTKAKHANPMLFFSF